MNQAYQDQQQSQSSQRLRNEQQPNDINQLAPSVAQPGFAPLGVGVHSPLDRASARESGGVAPTFDRGYIINDLRQQGFAVDDWRVVNQNGRWWFWSPDNSWLYFNDGINGSGAKAAWVPYRGNLNRANDGNSRLHNFAVPAGYPAENWRLVEHEGRMWFWTPDRTWMYFSGGRWNDYPAGGYVDGGDRYRVGYRGGNLDPVQPRGVAGPIYRDAGPSQTTNPVRAEGNPLRAQDEAGMNVDAED